MGIPEELQERIGQWHRLSRWERSEIGRDLRRLGLSYGEIRQLIAVKKSTLATWCREIQLTDEQAKAIKERTGSRAGIPVDTQWRRRLAVRAIQEEARTAVRHLVDDPLWVSGVVLYWAEGNKTRPMLGLSNSDPSAIRLFIKWCRCYHRPDADFTLKLNLHADNDEAAARRWWAAETGLPQSRFYKTFVKPDGTGHRKNHLSFGVCMVRMKRSADAFFTTMAWIEGLVERFEATGHPPRISTGR